MIYVHSNIPGSLIESSRLILSLLGNSASESIVQEAIKNYQKFILENITSRATELLARKDLETKLGDKLSELIEAQSTNETMVQLADRVYYEHFKKVIDEWGKTPHT